MIIKILGFLDVLIGICFWLSGIFNIIPRNFIFILGLFLLVKGVIFISGLSVVSFLDIVFGVVIIIESGFEIPNIIVSLISIFLIQKGIFSLIS